MSANTRARARGGGKITVNLTMKNDDKKKMRDNAEELRKQFARLMREERQGFERLKDILHKYRTALPYLYGRSKGLEERLGLLMEHQDETKAALAAVRSKHRLAQMQIKQAEENLKEARQRKNAVITRHNALLGGKLPAPADASDAGLNMEGRRERFMARLSEAFAGMEREVATLDREIAGFDEARNKLVVKAARLAKKAKISETKLALYQNDIRDVMVELNTAETNEQKIAAEYLELVRLLKSVADISPWGMKVFAEALEKELPAGKMLQLQKPAGNILQLH
ncbi:MAG: hypothetical protein HZA04_03315 [Nitrospinae bacterium]|nr:hypothetical protein [Nitrospinota bacterium]